MCVGAVVKKRINFDNIFVLEQGILRKLNMTVFASGFSATLGSMEFALLYDSVNNALHCTISKARVGGTTGLREMLIIC